MSYIGDSADVHEFVFNYIEFLMSRKSLYKYKPFLLKRAYNEVYAYYKDRNSYLKSPTDDGVKVMVTQLYHEMVMPLVLNNKNDPRMASHRNNVNVGNKSAEVSKKMHNRLQLKSACGVVHQYLVQNLSEAYLCDFVSKFSLMDKDISKQNKVTIVKCQQMVFYKAHEEMHKHLSNKPSQLKDLSEKQLISFTKKEIKTTALPYLKKNLIF